MEDGGWWLVKVEVEDEEERSGPPIGPYRDPNLWHAHNTARSIRTAQARVSTPTHIQTSVGVLYMFQPNVYDCV